MDAALMSSQLNAVSPMLIMMIGPRPDDMKPGIHRVGTHWIRGFMAFQLERARPCPAWTSDRTSIRHWLAESRNSRT